MRASSGHSVTAQLLLIVLASAAMPAAALAAGEEETTKNKAVVFATVGDAVVTVQEFEASLHAGMRQRFYHGTIPEAERRSFRREVGQALIDRVLLQQEARRRGIQPDEAWVAERVAEIEARMASSPAWKHAREEALAGLRAQLAGESLIQQLRERVTDIPPPDAEELRRFYEQNKEKFTTPERLRVSMILLRVQPWAPEATWQAALDEARRLLEKLRQGAAFAGLARLHSADPSAERGGDLGYIHEGMLAAEAQQVLDDLSPGELSAPVRLLKGYALFRLDDRQPPVANELAAVEGRARGLLLRQKRQDAWRGMLGELRDSTPVEINEALLTAVD